MDEVSPDVLSAMSFAQSLAREHAERGGDAVDLLAAYAGLVAERDDRLAATCLGALDGALQRPVDPAT